ncbi:MAG TPA: lysylphosphatidylglycerol synthase transmembrane domain-containing protein [Candidatus Dormibacteraeota bacterium]|nr:lysylphosphatidylglycerol synthase transmembrane domain-containing protein [Candidatus Dormibacteraeota bacterium]
MRFSARKIVLLAGIVLGAGFLFYHFRAMFSPSQFSGGKVLNAVREANPFYLILALITIYVCYAVRALRWQRFQKHVGRSNFWDIYRMTLAGFAAVFLLGRPGEPVRPVLLARQGKIPIADTFGIWALERLFDVGSMAVIAAIALLVFKSGEHTGEAAATVERTARTAGALLSAGLVAAVAALVYLRVHGTSALERRLGGWLTVGGLRGQMGRIILGFIRGIQTVRSWQDLVSAVLYSGIHWFLVLVVYFLITRSFAGRLAELRLSDCMLLLAFTLVGSIVQLPAVGGGSQALAIFAFTRVFGVESEPAVAAAMVIWLVTFAGCSLAGVPFLLHQGMSLGKLREFAEQEKEAQGTVAAGMPVANRRGESTE